MVNRARLAEPRAAIVTRNTHEPIDPGRWNRIQEVLADAIECPREDRDAFLDRRCAGDLSLRYEIDSLLLAHDSDGLIDRLQPLVKRPDDFPTLPSPARSIAEASLPVTDWSGRTVARYRVLDAIGSGGMAVVYRARDERLGRHVALKFLSPSLRTDPRAKRAFVAEARAAAALDHPNVCTIYEIDDTEDAQLFIAMPLYEGETLRERLDRGRMTFSDVLPVALQIARGLAHAHDAGIVHRDIKPSNIVILPDGTAKILDFGIAQIHDASRTPPQLLVGTVAYMSPEQARGLAVDCRSDVWSLAVVLHEMLTGSRPFDGADARAVRHAILDSAPQLTSGSYPDVPASLESILRRALAKRTDDRYVSMTAFANDLAGLAAEPDRRAALADVESQAREWTTERRRTAVLVTCVSDYLSLVDQMPAAEAHRLVARLRDVAVDVAREYGGLVNQAIGEEIVSLFGVPIAHDDDDLRAVRAALELHARVQNVDPRLRVQSGLHVGVLVARRLHEGPRRYEIAGTPVALASRLAALAEPGSVWVTPQTQRLVGPYVHTVACAPTVIDPHEGSVTPFRVLGETGIATRLEVSTRAGLTPYVGRQSELSTVQALVVRGRSGVGIDRGDRRRGGCRKKPPDSRAANDPRRRGRHVRSARALSCLRRRRALRGVRTAPVRGTRPAAAARQCRYRRGENSRIRSRPRALRAALAASAVDYQRSVRAAETLARGTPAGGIARRAGDVCRCVEPTSADRCAGGGLALGRHGVACRVQPPCRIDPVQPRRGDCHQPGRAGRSTQLAVRSHAGSPRTA